MMIFFKRLCVVFTAIVFFIQQFPSTSLAQPISFLSEAAASNQNRAFDLQISPQTGTVSVLSQGTGPVVIHIQTAHGNYEAEKKIQELLHELKNQYGIQHIFVEGSAYPLRPEALKLVSDKEINQAIAEELTQKALFKGVDLFLLDEPEIKAEGIEDPAVYLQNVDALREVLIERKTSQEFLNEFDLQMERLTGSYLNKDLRAFLKRLEGFETERVSLIDWLSYLRNETKKILHVDLSSPAYQLDWPTLVRIFKLKDFEKKLDAASYAQEREAFLEAARPYLKEESQSSIKNLLNNPVSGNQRPYPATGRLFEEMLSALPRDFDHEAYPNVRIFIAHLIIQSEIAGTLLSREMEDVSERIAKHLAKTPEEEAILDLLKSYRLLKRLFALQLTPSDYEKLSQDMRPSLITRNFLRINQAGRVRDAEFKHMTEMDRLYDRALDFYVLAKERDRIMYQNVLKKMEEGKIDKAVVLTGGFHAQPFQNFFEEANFNYALITPSIQTRGGYETYVANFLAGFDQSTLEFGEAALPYDQRLGWNKANAVEVAMTAAKKLAAAGRLVDLPELNQSAFALTSKGRRAFRVTVGNPPSLENVQIDFAPQSAGSLRSEMRQQRRVQGRVGPGRTIRQDPAATRSQSKAPQPAWSEPVMLMLKADQMKTVRHGKISWVEVPIDVSNEKTLEHLNQLLRIAGEPPHERGAAVEPSFIIEDLDDRGKFRRSVVAFRAGGDSTIIYLSRSRTEKQREDFFREVARLLGAENKITTVENAFAIFEGGPPAHLQLALLNPDPAAGATIASSALSSIKTEPVNRSEIRMPQLDESVLGLTHYATGLLPRPLSENLATFLFDAGSGREISFRLEQINLHLADAGYPDRIASIRMASSSEITNEVRGLVYQTLGRDLPDNVRLVIAVDEVEVPDAALIVAGFSNEHPGHLTLVMPLSAPEAKRKEQDFENRLITSFHLDEGIRERFKILPAGTKIGYDDAETQLKRGLGKRDSKALMAVTVSDPEAKILPKIPASPGLRRFNASHLNGNMSIGGSVSLLLQLPDDYHVIIQMSDALLRFGDVEKIQALIQGLIQISRAA